MRASARSAWPLADAHSPAQWPSLSSSFLEGRKGAARSSREMARRVGLARPGRRVVASAAVATGGPNGGRGRGRASAPWGAVCEEGADDVDVAALARQHERGDAFSVLRWTNGGGAGRATRSGVVAPGGTAGLARGGSGGPARGGRATGGAEGTATPREGRGGDRPGTPGRRRREAPRRPLPRPRRSPRGATAASSSPPTARRGEGRSATRRSEPLRSESRRRERPPRSARLGFDRGRFTDRRLALVSVERRFLKASSVRRRVDSSDPTRGPF